MRVGEKVPMHCVIMLCVRILKIPILSGLSHPPGQPIPFESLPRSMKIYTVLTMLALLVLSPCLVTSNGGDGMQGPDETDYIYYLIVK